MWLSFRVLESFSDIMDIPQTLCPPGVGTTEKEPTSEEEKGGNVNRVSALC
jgi:hypothetical protein